MRKYVVFVVFAIISLLYLYSINGIEYAEPDTGYYLVLAKSLSIENGYRLISHPANPFEKQVLPVYPIILVPVFWFANGSYSVARLITVLFAIATLPIIYFISRRFFDERVAIYATIIMALSPMFMIYSRKILTDVPYLFFFLTFMALTYQHQNSNDRRYFIYSLFFLIPLLFTRIVGIVVLTVMLLYSIGKKQSREAVIFGALVLLFVVYLIYTHNYYSNPTIDLNEFGPEGGILSLDFFRILLERFIGYFFYYVPLNLFPLFNLLVYLYPMSISFSLPLLSLNNLLLVSGCLISIVMSYGLYTTAKKNITLFEIITIVYLVSIIIEHRVTGNGRLLLPVLLFFIIYFISGLRSIKILNQKVASMLLYEIILLLIIVSALGFSITLSVVNHKSKNPDSTENYITLAKWIQENTNESDIVISDRPFYMYLYSDRKSIDFSEYSLEAIKRSNITCGMYIVLGGYYSPDANLAYKDILKSNRNRFRERYSLDDHYSVYEVLRDVY
ncbi:MAG: glycosyltransferase family 39 protein [Candidatus Altiarchaeota archaeon]